MDRVHPQDLSGFLRGNRVTWDGQTWRDSLGRDARLCGLVCPACQAFHAPDDADACLGRIPGASSACCGHGVHVGYINWPGIPAPDGWRNGAYIGE